MSLALKAMFEPVRTLGFAAIGAGYVGVGTSLNYPTRMTLIQNTTDAILMFSFDGINDNFPLLANTFLLLDLSSNKTIETGYFIAKGERLYVKNMGTAPTTGSVYFTAIYGIDY
jgi:hypothetical protein